MKIIAVLFVPLLLLGYFFFQGKKSLNIKPPQMAHGKLPVCGAKPNCVCSEQLPTDAHYVEPIALNSNSLESIAQALESMGGVIVSRETDVLQATFTSGIFRFVDDLMLRIENDQIHVRSSSRVGHSDLGANKKRIEHLRAALH